MRQFENESIFNRKIGLLEVVNYLKRIGQGFFVIPFPAVRYIFSTGYFESLNNSLKRMPLPSGLLRKLFCTFGKISKK